MAESVRAFIEELTGIELRSTVRRHGTHLRVRSFDYGIDASMRDGIVTDVHDHSPVLLTFDADVETAALLNAITRHAAIPRMVVRFYRLRSKRWEPMSTVTLRDVRVQSLRFTYTEADGVDVTAQLIFASIVLDLGDHRYENHIVPPQRFRG